MKWKYRIPYPERSCISGPDTCCVWVITHQVLVRRSQVSLGFFWRKLGKRFPRYTFSLYYKDQIGGACVCFPMFMIVTGRDVTLLGPDKLVHSITSQESTWLTLLRLWRTKYSQSIPLIHTSEFLGYFDISSILRPMAISSPGLGQYSL